MMTLTPNEWPPRRCAGGPAWNASHGRGTAEVPRGEHAACRLTGAFRALNGNECACGVRPRRQSRVALRRTQSRYWWPSGGRPLRRDSLHDAHHETMECLGEMIWQSQRSGLPPDGHQYLDCVRRRATRD